MSPLIISRERAVWKVKRPHRRVLALRQEYFCVYMCVTDRVKWKWMARSLHASSGLVTVHFTLEVSQKHWRGLRPNPASCVLKTSTIMSDATLSPVSLIVNVFNHLNQLNTLFIPGTASRTDTPSHSISILAHARESYSSAPEKRTLDVGCKRLCPGRYFQFSEFNLNFLK